jgi:hypothetical protein
MTREAIYERLPNETGPAWAAFCVFREMGPERTQAATCRSIGKSQGHIHNWAKKYRWKARAAAWDAYVDQHNRLSEVKAVAAMKERQLEISILEQEIAKKELIKLKKESDESDKMVITVRSPKQKKRWIGTIQS